MNDTTSAPALRADAAGALLARVALGDQRAFAALYRTTAAPLYAIALRLVRERAVAEEMLQDAFVSVWHHARAYDAAKSEAMTWLASIVRHRALERLHRRGDAAAAPGDDGPLAARDAVPGAPAAEELLLAGAAARSIGHCVDALDPGPKQALALALFHGFSRDEIAAHLREPRRTVRAWLGVGLDRLRRCLDAAVPPP